MRRKVADHELPVLQLNSQLHPWLAWFQGSVHSGASALSPLSRAHSRSRPSLQAAPMRGPSSCAFTPNK